MNSKISAAFAVIAAVTLAACGGAPPPETTARVGAAGATLKVGGSALTIPAGAVSDDVVVTVRETEPHHAGRAKRIEIEPHGLGLGKPAMLSVVVDDRNGRVKMHESENEIEHPKEVELEDRGRHSWKTSMDRLTHVEVEVEHARACAVACSANEECDDGVCKPHVEDAPTAACAEVCGAGLECEDGACKPHGGANGGGR